MDRTRLASASGFLAPTIAIGAIVLATVVASPETFTWRDHALSEMGAAGAETFWLFNGGLVVAGLVGIPFGWLLWRRARNHLERAGVVGLVLAVVGMVGVGVFFLGHDEYYLSTDLHFPAAALVFVGTPIATWIYASGLAVAGERRYAILTAALGLVHPVTWLLWVVSVQGAADPTRWFAVPEMVAALAFAAWVVLLAAVSLREADQAADSGAHNA